MRLERTSGGTVGDLVRELLGGNLLVANQILNRLGDEGRERDRERFRELVARLAVAPQLRFGAVGQPPEAEELSPTANHTARQDFLTAVAELFWFDFDSWESTVGSLHDTYTKPPPPAHHALG